MKINYFFKSQNLQAIIIISILSFLAFACQTQKKAIGLEDEIIVVADSSEYDVLVPELYNTFSKVIYTPQPENIFNLTRISINQLNEYQRRKNIIVIAPLDSKSYTSNYINSILDDRVKELINQDSVYVINKHDMWFKNQLVMFIVGKDMETLNKNLIVHRDRLLSLFQMKSNSRLSEAMYNPKFENQKMEAELLKNYGWIVYCMSDFTLGVQDSVENFVWLRRGVNTDMERWISVHWIDNASPELLNADSIYAIRNRLTNKFFRTTDKDAAWVEISDAYLTTSEINFNGRYAMMTQGLWRFNDHSGGGPFLSYTFIDEKSGRLYMLDGSIFAPKYKKKALIQQVDINLLSFLTKEELSEDRINNLLDQLD